MKAIIVPGVTDLNKGDQALVWESYRLIEDVKCFNDIYILSNGDTSEERNLLCKQTEDRGYKLIENILKHPRRGKHNKEEHIRESKLSFAIQVKNAIVDLTSLTFLLGICNNLSLVKLLYSKEVYHTVKHFKESETVFVKGGGFIHAYGEKTAPYLMWFFLFYVRLAKRLNKKVVVFPNSYGPFEGITVKEQVKSVLNKVDLLYAREHVSASKLATLLEKEIEVSPDLGFYLKAADCKVGLQILENFGVGANDKVIGITIRPWRFPGKPNPEVLYENYISSIVELVKYVLGAGYKVALCNQSLGPNSHEDDRNAILQLLGKVDHPNLIWINENLPCDELKSLYSNFYFFIGTRFHSVIFSMTSLVPSIAIGYGGNKARGIMADFNLDKYVVQIDEVSKENLRQMFDDAIESYDSIKAELREKTLELEIKREKLIQEIKDLHH